MRKITILTIFVSLTLVLTGCSRFPQDNILDFLPVSAPSLEQIVPAFQGEWFGNMMEGEAGEDEHVTYHISSGSLAKEVTKNVVTKVSVFMVTARLPAPQKQQERIQMLIHELRE
ncbi:hypothetical protein VIBNISFn27_80021 [Vibrio nigripulchritudo SFn27]|uniref:Uncharacterized protein n=1 Tax=Vibrio nigripulchritudo TaxID=28173 RepID=U4KDR9_9VIBR|nr:hypothetical protein [Vibrio nigripulchritudo]CCN83521.1 hypothetical protein VIBNIBLFn1_610040 [Vibrio nigripulchritudo BLFn1]CCN90942.1 hypothetical protein VIBNISFn27_80021 [Vibrio nigripulchritudo SFn27]CCN95165.1 hypothetical protein VIBNIENn2_490021 [Vibrio nigripulchritudo ENn2]CCO42286.1 hypothetical protein VIBNISFn135_800021 [Vibrio nigripulchritudo SFn135]CCO52181.1 hypothetical protein VIBNIWn13_260021 [Vibrio nigripulchritudo Wn13]